MMYAATGFWSCSMSPSESSARVMAAKGEVVVIVELKAAAGGIAVHRIDDEHRVVS